ncbi:MAG: ABA4-like family protein [Alphaproteobacteria bacterium]
MPAEFLYKAATIGVMPLWLLLAFLPNAAITRVLIQSVAPPLVLGALYAWLFHTVPGSAIDFTSLEGLRATFQSDAMLLAGWVHYLVFDLFVGAWIVRDGRRRDLWYPLLVPCLFLTFLMGPVGLLVYLVLRATRDHDWFRLE